MRKTRTYRTSTFLVAALAAFALAGCAGGSGGAGTAGSSGGTTSGAAGNGATAGSSGGGVIGAGGGAASSAAGSIGATGIAGTGGATGAVGGAGTTGGAGHGGAFGGGGAGGSGGSGSVACASFPFCETFESSTVGAAPNPSTWTVVNGNSVANGTATIDGVGARGSSRSVKIVAGSRFWLRNGAVIGTLGDVVHARFYVRFGVALPSGHSGIFSTDPTMLDPYTDQPQLRFGAQDMVFHWNTDVDANIPDVSPQGDALSFKPATNTWYCLELTINKANGHLAVSVDDTDIPGLAEDGTPTANVDQQWLTGTASTMRYATLAEFSIGWVPFNGGSMTLWFDEIALSSGHIGCN